MNDLAQRTAVVTGAANGIGRAMVGRLATAGMRVVLADIDERDLAAAATELESAGHQVLGVPTDVSDPASVDQLADAAWSRFGHVHLLHNNAGVGLAGNAWETTLADWAWLLGVNLHGVIHGIRSFVPRMLDHGGPGHVVNTASMAALAAPPGLAAYAASKHAVLGLSEALRRDLIAVGSSIGVTVVCPGVVTTDIARAERHRPKRFQNSRGGSPAVVPLALPPTIDPDDASLGVLSPMTAEDVADRILEAIAADRFLVLTHQPAAEHLIRTHLADLLG